MLAQDTSPSSGLQEILKSKICKEKSTKAHRDNTKNNEILSLLCNIFKHQLYDIWLSFGVDSCRQIGRKAHFFVVIPVSLIEKFRGFVLNFFLYTSDVLNVGLIQSVIKNGLLNSKILFLIISVFCRLEAFSLRISLRV